MVSRRPGACPSARRELGRRGRARGARRPLESDCESSGADEITYPQIPPDVRAGIESGVVPEFGGLVHLPRQPQTLLTFEP